MRSMFAWLYDFFCRKSGLKSKLFQLNVQRIKYSWDNSMLFCRFINDKRFFKKRSNSSVGYLISSPRDPQEGVFFVQQ